MEERAGKNIYHEKQSKQLCALHTLNNLFQDPKAFTKPLLDELCCNLTPGTWMNPHRSLFGLGNYDINVIIAALQLHSCEVTWWDKRRQLSVDQIQSCFGLIINKPSPSKVGGMVLPFKTKHWIAIRKLGSIYFNLDSKLDEPLPIGNHSQLIEYLTRQLEGESCELFIVNSLNSCTTKEVSWYSEKMVVMYKIWYK